MGGGGGSVVNNVVRRLYGLPYGGCAAQDTFVMSHYDL